MKVIVIPLTNHVVSSRFGLKSWSFAYIHRPWAQCMPDPSSPRPCRHRCSTWLTPDSWGWCYERSCICSSERWTELHPCPHIQLPSSWWFHRSRPQCKGVGTRNVWNRDEWLFPRHCVPPVILIKNGKWNGGQIKTIRNQTISLNGLLGWRTLKKKLNFT